MTIARQTLAPRDAASTAAETHDAPLGSPERPIRTLAELQEWVDATGPAQAAADQRRAELIRSLIQQPFGVFGL